MPYQASGIGIGQARLNALQEIVRRKVPDLNAVLVNDPETLPLMQSPFSPCRWWHVLVGDLRLVWQPTDGAVRIYLAPGMPAQQGLDFQTKREYIDRSSTDGLRLTLNTDVLVYFHPTAFQVVGDEQADVEQARRIVVAQERISDWLRYVLQSTRTDTVGLESREYSTGNPDPQGNAENDYLLNCLLTMGYKGYFARNMGNSQIVYGFHAIHSATMA